MGDRKFRFRGKTFVVDSKNRLFCAINFEDPSGMFSKSKWEFNDEMDGEIVSRHGCDNVRLVLI